VGLKIKKWGPLKKGTPCGPFDEFENKKERGSARWLPRVDIGHPHKQ